MLTCPCDVDPLAFHFYRVKLGFTWVYIFLLFLLHNIDRGYSLELPQSVSEAVLTCTHNLCFEQHKEKYHTF